MTTIICRCRCTGSLKIQRAKSLHQELIMEKGYDGSERRKFKRIVFSAKDEVMGVFKFSGLPDKSVSYKLADFSAGGLRFILPRNDELNVSIGDTFFLHEIKGRTQLEFSTYIELEVKWTMDHEIFQHIMIGCEFIHMTETFQKQIERFAESELARPNQDS
jgi:c-di-GMP-binding flagellar brake protein YcgR